MTTIVGLETLYKGSPAIVLASDMTGTGTDFDDKGDVVVRRRVQAPYKKLYVAQDEKSVIGIAGVYDTLAQNLIREFVKGNLDLRTITDKGFLPEIEKIHLQRAAGQFLRQENSNSALIACLDDKGSPALYTCFPLGRVERRDGTAIGSGADYALDFMNQEIVRDRGTINLTSDRCPPLLSGVDLARRAIRHAAKDIYTKGLDLVVLTPEGVKEYGERIRTAIDGAEEKEMNLIRAELEN